MVTLILLHIEIKAYAQSVHAILDSGLSENLGLICMPETDATLVPRDNP